MGPVLIQFSCYPFRSAGRLDVPLDAPEDFQALCRRFVAALRRHGTEHTYYVHGGTVEFRLANGPGGSIVFAVEGTVWTDAADRKTQRVDLACEAAASDFGPLEPAVGEFFRRAVERAFVVEFDRYIESGDLERTVRHAKAAMLQSEQRGGYVGGGI